MSETMEKIQKIALTKLLKLELPQFVKQVTKCMEKHNPEGLKLDDTYNLLVEQRNKMALLTVPYGPHPLTKKIHQLHLKRLKYAAAITSQMNFISKMNLEEMRCFVRLSHPTVRLHLYYLRQNNQFIIDQTITAFFLHLSENPEILNALETLGLKLYLDELLEANIQHHKLCMKRSEEISQRPKIDTLGIQRDAHYVLRSLFEQINFYQFTYREIDYSKLIGEINGLITRFAGLIHTRETCNRTRKNKAKTKDAGVELIVRAEANEDKFLLTNAEDTLRETIMEDEKTALPLTSNPKAIERVSIGSLIQNLKLPDLGVRESLCE